jgi:hypothetical protein
VQDTTRVLVKTWAVLGSKCACGACGMGSSSRCSRLMAAEVVRRVMGPRGSPRTCGSTCPAPKTRRRTHTTPASDACL